MNKADLINEVASKAEMSKKDCAKVVDAVFQSITEALKKDGEAVFVGFGTFKISERPMREGRNPRTGQVIKINAAKVAKFKPGKVLKDFINGELPKETSKPKVASKK